MGVEDGNEANQQMDPVILHARRKMEALGKDPLFAEAIMSAASIEDIDNQASRLHLPANYAQILAYPFHALCALNPALKLACRETLAPVIDSWELPEDYIDLLITESDYPELSLTGRYRDKVPYEEREKFGKAISSFMFRELK